MVNFWITKNGVFEELNTELFKGYIGVKFPLPILEEEDTVAYSKEEIKEKIQIVFKRMPLALFQQTLAFLEWCYKEMNSEGMVCFRYKDGVWGLVCPEQWVDSTSVCYHIRTEESTSIVGDVHSHPKFASSTHSSTDNLDERKTQGIYMVVKDFTLWTCDPTITGVVRGTPFSIKPEYFIDISGGAELKATFPEEWKARVHRAPCDECKRQSEAAKAAEAKAKALSKYEEDKKTRLVPETIVEAYRKFRNEKTTGLWVVNAYRTWNQKTSIEAKLLRCKNWGCEKSIREALCPECKKSLSNFEIVDSVARAIDEVEIWNDFNGKLEDMECLITLTDPALVQNGDKASEKSTTPTAKSPNDTDIILVSRSPECDEKCPLKKRNITHTHLAEKNTAVCTDKICAESGHLLISCANRKTTPATPTPSTGETFGTMGPEDYIFG